MNMEDFINYCKAGNSISEDDKVLQGLLIKCSIKAQQIIMQLNSSFHSKEEFVATFSELTGNKIDSTFM
ncbi:hypothetical protein [Bacillus safensis]|uniref:hypothetical protein n=1 Tax=Bacillus safensis TaxID=561879 RepID=UPI000A80548C|nr:hypothetical protein [Bacillus safensis]